jgi:hypothetical protein
MTLADFDTTTGAQLAIAAAGGALGGLTRYFATKQELARTVLSGIIAAFAAIFVTRPSDWLGLVTGAAVSGFAADAVLAGYLSRVKLETAKLQAEAAKTSATQASKKLGEAETDLAKAVGAMKTAAAGGPEATGLEIAGGGAGLAGLAAQLEAAQNERRAS